MSRQSKKVHTEQSNRLSNEKTKDDPEDDFDFKHKGKVDDEITLQFDDGTEYYVSSIFLKMSSPVFRRMLESDFKEKSSGVVKLKGKDPSTFLKLLYCLHPSKQEKVTEETVFAICPLAEEHEVISVIAQCKSILVSIITEVEATYAFNENVDKYLSTNSFEYYDHETESVILCYNNLSRSFQVLMIAELYGYGDIVEKASNLISKFPSSMYLERGEYPDSNEHFDKLSTEKQNILLKRRLMLYDIQEKVPPKRVQ